MEMKGARVTSGDGAVHGKRRRHLLYIIAINSVNSSSNTSYQCL